MKSINKIQNECSLLELCIKNSEVINKVYDGYIIKGEDNRCVASRGKHMELYEYSVYVPELKIISKIKLREKVKCYTKHKISLYLFEDEERFKKKIRLQLIP
jgi:hypothetical protein